MTRPQDHPLDPPGSPSVGEGFHWKGLLENLETLAGSVPERHRDPLLHGARLIRRDFLGRGLRKGLVVGMVGPNNAGKSAVFNGLCQQTISPSKATGGATRRLLAASHSTEDYPSRGFESVVPVTVPREGMEAALLVGPPGELLLARAESLPPDVLLVDAPDFDSVLAGHHATARDLLLASDLALVVVTRHSYQNLAVVEFLKEGLRHGRPFVLLYNEAPRFALALEHLHELQTSLGVTAQALFAAEFDQGVAEGNTLLQPRQLGADGEPGNGLREWLLETADHERLQQAAQSAALRELRTELSGWHAKWQARDRMRLALLEVVDRETERYAEEIAGEAMPMGPVLDAFRRVLDRDPGLLRSTYRKGLRKAGQGMQFVMRRVLGKLRSTPPDLPTTLMAAEWDVASARWAPFVERLRENLQATGADKDPDWAPLIDDDLAAGRFATALESLKQNLAHDPEVMREFGEYCEAQIEAEVQESGSEWALQAMLDLAHLLPAAVAGVIVVQSGGLLTDVAVGSMGAMSSMIAERLSKFLGTQTARNVRRRWIQLRRSAWHAWIIQAAMPQTAPQLQGGEPAGLAPVLDWLESKTP